MTTTPKESKESKKIINMLSKAGAQYYRARDKAIKSQERAIALSALATALSGNEHTTKMWKKADEDQKVAKMVARQDERETVRTYAIMQSLENAYNKVKAIK